MVHVGGEQAEVGEGNLRGVDMDDLLRELLVRVHDVVDEQARLRLLLDAVVTMAADLSLDSVLERIVSIASRLVDARYAALGVVALGPDRRLRTFVHHGMEGEVVRRIGDLPTGMVSSACSSRSLVRSACTTSRLTRRRTASLRTIHP